MPRNHTEVDHELLRDYVIPALELMAVRFRHPLGAFDGAPKPGRAKTAELAVEWLNELLAIEAEHRALLLQLKHGRALPADDADNWLAAMERDCDRQAAEDLGAVTEAHHQTSPYYRCPECGIEIEPGDRVAAGIRGIIHAECPDLTGQYPN